MIHLIKQARHWLLLFFFTDLIFVFLTWLMRPAAFKNVSLFIVLFTVLVFFAGVWTEYRRQYKISNAARRFLEEPDAAKKEILLHAAGEEWEPVVEMLFSKMTSQASQINEKTIELEAYREYIEAWVHEIKSPLFLLELLVGNHKDEISPYVYDRTSYIRHQLNEAVGRILYYARLQADHVDYKFTKFRLDECVKEAVEEHQILMREKQMSVCLDLQPFEVVSDKKVLLFMLAQLFSNAVKYADADNGRISVLVRKEKDNIYLSIFNNGKGIPPEDAPFIFDKGFTGNHPNRQKATGMGLYLVQKYAQKLCIEVVLLPVSITGEGFGIELIFTL